MIGGNDLVFECNKPQDVAELAIKNIQKIWKHSVIEKLPVEKDNKQWIFIYYNKETCDEIEGVGVEDHLQHKLINIVFSVNEKRITFVVGHLKKDLKIEKAIKDAVKGYKK